MRSKLLAFPIVALLVLAPIVTAAGAAGQSASVSAAPVAGAAHPIVRYATRYDHSPQLRDIRPVPPRAGQLIQIKEEQLPNRTIGGATGDGALQTTSPAASSSPTIANFDGVSNLDGVLPPDPNGAVGENYYVQTVNLHYEVWDKSGNSVYGPVTINTLWSGFGGVCETSNDGDPIVQYDAMAHRWMISQFALPNYPFGDFYQCIAVSQTSDPTGSFNRYEFDISSNKMNDYPKFGVWPDAYYMSINQFKMPSGRWGGAGAVAFDRSAMLDGKKAQMVYFDLFNVDQNLGGMLPSDLDGPAPPAGAPNIFAQFDDDAWGYSPDQVQLWDFHVDWTTPSNSTFTHNISLQTAAFDSNMCGYSRNCIPQPGSNSTPVDAISDRLMYRLQYRNFGDHQTLVLNHTVDTNGQDHAGIRWYELSKSGGPWSIAQQGTFSPDATDRWMGSIAMNGIGDIALGYSVSSSDVYPSVRFTGRLWSDPVGLMDLGEGTIVDGSGSQTHSSGRWGDYSSLSVDPADDCTFWYTQEYYAQTGTAPWQTRIGSFRLRDCSTAPTPTPISGPTATPLTPSPTATAFATSATPTSFPATATPAPTSTSVPPSPTPTPTLISGTMFVDSLVGSSQNNGKTWQPMVTVTILSDQGTVDGATVSANWSGGASAQGSCITAVDGTCTIAGPDVRKNISSVTFTVKNVTGTIFTYVSTENHVTSITVSK